LCRPPSLTLFPYTTLFRSLSFGIFNNLLQQSLLRAASLPERFLADIQYTSVLVCIAGQRPLGRTTGEEPPDIALDLNPRQNVNKDRKSTRLNSSHVKSSYA